MQQLMYVPLMISYRRKTVQIPFSYRWNKEGSSANLKKKAIKRRRKCKKITVCCKPLSYQLWRELKCIRWSLALMHVCCWNTQPMTNNGHVTAIFCVSVFKIKVLQIILLCEWLSVAWLSMRKQESIFLSTVAEMEPIKKDKNFHLEIFWDHCSQYNSSINPHPPEMS